MGSIKDSAKSTTSNGSKISGILSSLPLPHSDIGTSIKEFQRAMAKIGRFLIQRGERGTFVVIGDIELVGPKRVSAFSQSWPTIILEKPNIRTFEFLSSTLYPGDNGHWHLLSPSKVALRKAALEVLFERWSGVFKRI